MTGPYRIEYRDGDGSFTSERVFASAMGRVLEDLAAGGADVRYIEGPDYACARCWWAVAVQVPEMICDWCRHEEMNR